MTHEQHNSHCRSLTKTGKPCRAAATEGGLCFFHANPNKASELGRIGGRTKHGPVEVNGELLPTVDNALAVRDTVARLIADVYSGRVQPKVAAGLAPLLNLQLRAIETSDLELRVAKLEKQAGNKSTEGNRPIRAFPDSASAWNTPRASSGCEPEEATEAHRSVDS